MASQRIPELLQSDPMTIHCTPVMSQRNKLSVNGSPESSECVPMDFYLGPVKIHTFPVKFYIVQMMFYTFPVKSHIRPEQSSCYQIRIDPDLLSVDIDQETFYTDPVKFDIDQVG